MRLRCCCWEQESLARFVIYSLPYHRCTNRSPQSTVLKQMKLIHHSGYNDSERRLIPGNHLLQHYPIHAVRLPPLGKYTDKLSLIASSAILEAMPQLDLALAPQNDARRATILSFPAQIEADVLPADVGDAVRSLWREPAVQEAVNRSCEFQLNDSAMYYFNAIDRMSSPSYLPTNQDILRSRVKTTGTTETTFKVDELTYKLFDVGGQRSEHKKWIHCFENVTALVFLISLSEYDQMLYEDKRGTFLSPFAFISPLMACAYIRTACKRL